MQIHTSRDTSMDEFRLSTLMDFVLEPGEKEQGLFHPCNKSVCECIGPTSFSSFEFSNRK